MKRSLKIACVVVVVGGAVFAGRPAVHLGLTWLQDRAERVPLPPVGAGDASHLSVAVSAEVIAVASDPVVAERQLAGLVVRAGRERRMISIAGAQHAMGGHTLMTGGLVVDMKPFHGLALDEEGRVLTAGAGARWSEVIPFLDRHGLAVNVMQSNNDFTVGGSVSVNCHGWQHHSPPIASTVESFRLITADGLIVRCSRTENGELFAHALGGYGLFGIILDVRLRVVPNEFYRAHSHRVKPVDYARVYRELTEGRAEVGMAYGRISVAPDSFLADGVIVLLERDGEARPVAGTLTEEAPGVLKRLVFRGSVGSDYGKNLRWRLETMFGETGGVRLTRNEIMNDPSGWFANRDPSATEVLHEYFVPVARLAEFLEAIRPVLLRSRPDLLNITVREVGPDGDTALPYAREKVFGLVMLFHQRRDAAEETAMTTLTRELIDAALSCGGTYYLPYRPHATREQFGQGYPHAAEFFAVKRRVDPAGIFENQFYLSYRVLDGGATR